MPVTRLARLLRQQDTSGLAPTLTSALATIGAFRVVSESDLHDIRDDAHGSDLPDFFGPVITGK